MRRDITVKGVWAIAVLLVLGIAGAAQAELIYATRSTQIKGPDGGSWIVWSPPLGTYLDYAPLNSTTDGCIRSLLGFDISTVLPVVTSATLSLHTTTSSTDLVVYRITREDWVETNTPTNFEGATWLSPDQVAGVANPPLKWTTKGGDYDSSASASDTADGLGMLSLDVTALVQDMVDAGLTRGSETWGSFLMVAPSGQAQGRAHSTRYASWDPYKPQMTVTSEDAIPEPGTLLLLGTGVIGLLGYIRRRRMH